MNEDEMYGGASIIDRINMLAKWAPLLAKLEAVAIAPTPHDRAIAIVSALRVAADQTGTAIDNTVLDHVEKILRTPEGAALVDWFATIAKFAEPPK
jgi:hypothetical protein